MTTPIRCHVAPQERLLAHGAFSLDTYPLSASVLLDSGASLHIFNDRRRFRNYKPAAHGEEVFAGASRVPILGWGSVTLLLTTPSGDKRRLQLEEVAHCEGFNTNLVSLRRLNHLGYYFHNKDDTLRKYKNERAIGKVFNHYNQFVLEFTPLTERLTRSTKRVRFVSNPETQPSPSPHSSTAPAMSPPEASRGAFPTHNYTSWTGRKPSCESGLLWHGRLGHPGAEAIAHLPVATEGAKIRGPTGYTCPDCGRAKAKRQIRREPREPPAGVGETIAIDFLDLTQDWQGMTSVMLLTCRKSGFVFDAYQTDRKEHNLKRKITNFLAIMEKQHGLIVKKIQTDNELLRSTALKRFFKDRNIVVEPSAPDTQAQNGGAERSGGVVKLKARAMRIAARFPHYLWVEIYKAAVYLHNRTPRRSLGWRTPYEEFHTAVARACGNKNAIRKPKLHHLRNYGCRAYAMTSEALRKTDRLMKMKPRAWIGYLIGYESTNIYRIWSPKANRVIRTRDVSFDEDTIFDGDINKFKDDLLEVSLTEMLKILEDCEIQEDEADSPATKQLHHDFQTQEEDEAEDDFTELILDEIVVQPQRPPARESFENQDQQQGDVEHAHSGTSAVEKECHLSETFESEADISELIEAESTKEVEMEREIEHETGPLCSAYCACQPLQTGSTQPLATDLLAAAFHTMDLNNQDIPLEGTDSHKEQPQEAWRAAFSAGRMAASVGNREGERVSRWQLYKELNHLRLSPRRRRQLARCEAATTAETNAESPPVAIKPRANGKYHRKDLPPAPITYTRMCAHPLEIWFRAAMADHMRSHHEMDSFEEVHSSNARGVQVLDCKWVYTYKFDKDGYLLKAKARLVVRGDQQVKADVENTYASTLAGRSFRTLMAIAARFDLELIQYDVVNAFVHAKMPYDVFMRMPRGFERQDRVLKLNKALYGLRESPLLWQKLFNKALREAGCEPVNHEPCCWIRNGVIIFFYVDDIVVAFREEKRAEAADLVAHLRSRFALQGGEEAQWFLGVAIVRDRATKTIYLSQAEYTRKMERFLTHRAERRAPKTPMGAEELQAHKGVATKAETQHYQRIVGTVLYAAVISRPDVAFAASRLARHNLNPGSQHLRAAERVVEYLVATASYALKIGGGDDFNTWTDASFADNSADRRSSQGYVMMLFGGAVGWKANKQDTVTTSTTEAELLALSQGAKEALYSLRLIQEIGVQLDEQHVQIWCDNTQTIRLVTADVATLNTKLRHVDIHNHWLREKIERREILVDYVPTKKQVADGLTKALADQDFQRFREQIGVVDIAGLLQQREGTMPEIKDDDLEAMEDLIKGGEAEVPTVEVGMSSVSPANR